MTPTAVQDIRNVALLGHAGSGKTTLLEALLAAAGEIKNPGQVERGDTLSDQDPLEKSTGHSLNTTLAHMEWAGHWINLLDTPGLPDLLGRSLLALPAVETAGVVVNASAGIEAATRKAMQASADKCRMVIVNQIDGIGLDLAGLMQSLTDTFGAECLPINLPTPEGKGVVDCFFRPDEGAATAFSSVADAHEGIVDQVVELDEALMNRYLEQGQSLDPEQLHDPFEKALREGHLIPVCFVSAKTGAGVPELLDILGRLMPDPTEGNPPHFVKGEGPSASPVKVAPDPNRHVIAHVFQVQNDPFRGHLALFRVHQGTMTPNTQLFIGDARKPFKPAHLFRLQGRDQVETPRAVPGDICAVARIDDIHRDAVLHDSHDEDYFHLIPPPYPKPVFGLALLPRKHGDEQRLSEALPRMLDEDPCLEVGFEAQTRQTVVRGLGALHLKLLLDQLAERWNLQLETATPLIPYRETVTANAEARYRHKKQSGGSGQFGEVALRIEPLPRGSGFEFHDEVKGGTIPGNFMGAVEKGVQQALEEGAVAGYPLRDVSVTVFDGKHHAVDSNEISFSLAARNATLEAARGASPVVLEPLVNVSVKAADVHFGEISSEFSGRRGRVTGTDSPAPGWIMIQALVPMAEMEGFEARLKSICAGDSEFVLSGGEYEPAPRDVQSELAQAYDGRVEAH
ncbi:MAG: elongation factor G [Thioalkalivibrio sp.]|nr:elongation factor G [Thioalkalivibrio sp.]